MVGIRKGGFPPVVLALTLRVLLGKPISTEKSGAWMISSSSRGFGLRRAREER